MMAKHVRELMRDLKQVLYNGTQDEIEYIVQNFDILVNKLFGGQNNMGTIQEEADAYEPKTTGNISELDKISTQIQLTDHEGTDKEGKPFNYKKFNVDGQDYRMPYSVLAALKIIREDMPNLQFFKVKKTGTGMNTSYQTIPVLK